MRDFLLGALMVGAFVVAGVRYGCLSTTPTQQRPAPQGERVQKNVPTDDSRPTRPAVRQLDQTNPYLL